jgi:predicted metal-binding membrane protein
VSQTAVTSSQTPLGLWPKARDDRLFAGIVASLIALAWVSLWLWQRSPQGRFLGHEDTAGIDGDYGAVLVVFVAGWTLMTIAMMLPTSLPLVAFFRSLVRARADKVRLVALLVLGYLAVWTGFAVGVHAGDQIVHATVARSGWLEANSWVIAAGTFAFAGAYQFSSLKHRCLEQCRTPVAFVLARWGRPREQRAAFRLGVEHGVFCLGCCWSLMLVMFAVGLGSLAWMLGLAVVMATEKNVSWGRQLSRPVGALLLVWSVVLTVAGVLGGTVV